MSTTKQRLANFHKLELAKEVSRLLEEKDIQFAFIKGVSFLGDIYSDFSLRFMSDIDVYIPSSHKGEILTQVLTENDFIKREAKTWLGNAHKEEWIHQKSGVNLEVHYQLFWHVKGWDQDDFYFKASELTTLKPELHFVYLCGHYCFQHTCQKLYWLIDFEFFLNKYELNWEEVRFLAKKLRLERSVGFVMKLLDSAFERRNLLSQAPVSFPVNDEVFLSDSLGAYSFLLKSYLKDSISDELRYNIFWLTNLISTKVASK